VDDRTTRILEALDSVGLEVLLALLAAPSTEADLVEAAENATQSTINRRLARLADAGLADHEAGKAHATGLKWSVNHAQEVDAVLQRIFDLADAVEQTATEQRETAKRQLTQARASRLGVRAVDRPRP
jgi:predicted transcriptional regulator